MNRTIKVGSRGSRLALVQTEEIKRLLNEAGVKVTFDHRVYQTTGDQDKQTPLTAEAADDFFTDTLDRAILNKEIDVAIHSAKDLPKCLADGLRIMALTRSPDETDAFVGIKPFQDLPPGARVGSSSETRQEALRRLRPDMEILPIRGTIEERLEQVRQGKYDGVVVATIALKRLGLADLIQDIMPWEAAPLQGQLAVVGRTEDDSLARLFEAIDARRSYGRVILVGAGPGDPDLITRKGILALNEADCVVYDYLVNMELLRHAPQAEHIFAGKRKGAHTMPQAELSRLLRHKAVEGRCVVRLKGGDPFIFGRGAEEWRYLKDYHIPVEIVAGVCSATAIPTHLGIPLTARGVAAHVAFVSAHAAEDTGESLSSIPETDTLVFFMGLSKLKEIVAALLRQGRSSKTPVAIVSRGTCRDEQTLYGTLETIVSRQRAASLPPPAIIIVGESVNYDRALYRN